MYKYTTYILYQHSLASMQADSTATIIQIQPTSTQTENTKKNIKCYRLYIYVHRYIYVRIVSLYTFILWCAHLAIHTFHIGISKKTELIIYISNEITTFVSVRYSVR